MSEDVAKLVRLYDEYVRLLAESEASMVGLAFAHGYKFPQKLVDRGAELRREIALLKSRLDL